MSTARNEEERQMSNQNRARLSPSEALTYIRGGRGACTLVGKDKHYAYSFSTPPDDAPAKITAEKPIFIRTTTGDSTYLGFFNQRWDLIAGRKGDATHPAFKALDWYVHKAIEKPEVAAQVEFWHEGSCCICGRPLTNPASIAAGIGPDCAGKTRHAHYNPKPTEAA